jgi:molybdate transport system ATP-binding protein
MELNLTTHIAILNTSVTTLNFNQLFSEDSFKKIVFFSELTLRTMVEEEAKHDTSVIFEREGQTLRSMSSGERKVALLNYLISLNPEYLCVENFYEHLDSKNHKKLEALIINASNSIKIIQVVRKEKELLPFISAYYFLEEGVELKPYLKSVASFFNNETNFFSKFNIPKTTSTYNYNYTTFIKLQHVSVSYLEKPVLNNISWEIKLGEFWQLIGENGSGKTTILSLITGDCNKAYGQHMVLFDKLKGTEENIWEIKQKIGYFTPNITELFNRRHTVLHMILSGFYDSIGLYVKPLDIHIKLGYEWLNLLGLTALAKKTFTTLPLAQQRMVLIARAMVKHPPLLILDEPTSGLNTKSASLIVSLIRKISQETKTTIIFVSHTIENGLQPDNIFKLEKSTTGSTGRVL